MWTPQHPSFRKIPRLKPGFPQETGSAGLEGQPRVFQRLNEGSTIFIISRASRAESSGCACVINGTQVSIISSIVKSAVKSPF